MSQKKPCVDSSRGRPRMDKCLPLEILGEILGRLDRDTLCTARLVSRTLCAAAALHIRSIRVTNTQVVSSHRFPHLRHVALDLSNEGERLALLDPRLRDLTTTLTVQWPADASILETLSEAALMPKLRKLRVPAVGKPAADLLRRCTDVETLYCGFSASVATAVVTMTRLTALHVGLGDGPRFAGFAPASLSDLARNLTNLQDLDIGTSYEHLPLIGKLTGLTGLSMWDPNLDCEEETTYSIAPLTRLTRLRSVWVGGTMGESNLRIACSLGSGSLVTLKVWGCEDASADCGRLLTCQTALTRLKLLGWPLCNLRHIGAPRIELLQTLKLDDLHMLDAEGLTILSRATSLNKLAIGIGFAETHMGLSQALAQLTRLHSLRITSCSRRWHDTTMKSVDFHVALSPLTALTKLKVRSHGLDDGELGALVALTGLRLLELDHCRLTDDVLPELGLLTNLNTLRVWSCGVTSLALVTGVLDPLRKARGLPPLRT